MSVIRTHTSQKNSNYLDHPNPRNFTGFEEVALVLCKPISNLSKLLIWLKLLDKFIQNPGLVDVAGCKASARHVHWNYFQIVTLKNVNHYLRNSRKNMSNSRKKGRTSTIPKKSYNRVFQNTPDHIIDCKTYDRCKVNEKFVKTRQNLNFTWKQEMLSRNVKDAPGSDFFVMIPLQTITMWSLWGNTLHYPHHSLQVYATDEPPKWDIA